MIDLITIYNYDNSIFDLLRLPSAMNKDDFINNLLLETAELELLYSRPDFLRFAIGAWSTKELDIWEKLEATLHYDYDPIYNTDRTETEIIKEDKSGTKEVNGSSTDTGSAGSTNMTEYNKNDISTTTNSVSAYDSDTLKIADKSNSEFSSKNNDSSKNSSTSTGTSTLNQSEKNSDSGTIERELRTYGNIGVTTTQALIEEERKVVQFCIDDYIINSFKRKFCILVY